MKRPPARATPLRASGDRWLFGYADVVTLLFACFAALYATRVAPVAAAPVPVVLPVLPKGPPPSVGDPVLAVGSPLGLGNSVSSGIVSAFHDGIIQFSAPISPGNSGGPVVDRTGRVVGVARSKLVGDGAEGLSFAIPIALVCSTVATC